MAAIDALSLQSRSVLFEVMMNVAWADRQLMPEERQAAQAAAVSLGLVLPSERDLTSPDHEPVPVASLEVSHLTPRDRELALVCAAWMAIADNEEQREETAVLEQLRGHLGVAPERMSALRAHARGLRARQAVDRTSWWRAFDKLIVEAARSLDAG
jgi:tellurite resistance protein